MKLDRRKLIGAFAIVVMLVALVAPLFPATAASDICKALGESAKCTEAEVGPFMAGISRACGNEGTCSLTDIQIVFVNIGNYILGIVGALVLLAYVVGGFWFLASGAPGVDAGKLREKGKDALKKSTFGLVIVFIAFAALQTISDVLTGGTLSTDAAWVACGPGDINKGEACGYNKQCTEDGLCLTLCEIAHPSSDTWGGAVFWSECVDTTEPNYGKGAGVISTGCETNLCPGGNEIQCCSFEYSY